MYMTAFVFCVSLSVILSVQNFTKGEFRLPEGLLCSALVK